jgi:hypothetical protein
VIAATVEPVVVAAEAVTAAAEVSAASKVTATTEMTTAAHMASATSAVAFGEGRRGYRHHAAGRDCRDQASL